ncbi:MAG: glycosyltransferase family 39 protein, partial [Anaerolineae bacterium]
MNGLLDRRRSDLGKRPAGYPARWAGWGLLLLAFGLRTYALGGQELTFDEVASVYIADRGPFELLTYVTGAVREHPPLYYLLLSLWMSLAGTSEFAVRFLSVIIGIVTVAATFRVLQRASRPSLALLSTLLLVVSPFHVRISRDARMYGLLALW